MILMSSLLSLQIDIFKNPRRSGGFPQASQDKDFWQINSVSSFVMPTVHLYRWNIFVLYLLPGVNSVNSIDSTWK